MGLLSGPMPPFGHPRSRTCRHCGGPRLKIKDTFFCERCDAPEMPDGTIVRPTWKPRFTS